MQGQEGCTVVVFSFAKVVGYNEDLHQREDKATLQQLVARGLQFQQGRWGETAPRLPQRDCKCSSSELSARRRLGFGLHCFQGTVELPEHLLIF